MYLHQIIAEIWQHVPVVHRMGVRKARFTYIDNSDGFVQIDKLSNPDNEIWKLAYAEARKLSQGTINLDSLSLPLDFT